MTHPPRVTRAGEAETGAQFGGLNSPSAAVDSLALMSGKRELLIRHGDELYRLRVTASNKLILTK